MRPADSPPDDEPDHRRLWSMGAALDDGLHSVVDTTGSDRSTDEQPNGLSAQPGRSPPVVSSSQPTHQELRVQDTRWSHNKPPPPQSHLRGSLLLAGYQRPRTPEQVQRRHPPMRTWEPPVINSHRRGGRRWQLIL